LSAEHAPVVIRRANREDEPRVLTLMEHAGAGWWLWVWLIWLVWTMGLTWAFPKFIAPFFNRFSPLTDEALKKRVEILLERCGFAARGGVFVMDGSSG